MDTMIVHVMASDLARGGQAEARTVCDALNRQLGANHHQALTIFAGPPGNLRAEHQLGVTVGAARRAGFDPRGAIALRRWLRANRPRLIVAHGGEALKYALAAAGRTPVVYHKIGIVADGGRRGLRRVVQRILHRRPCGVIAVSADTAADAAEFGRGDGVIVVPNCRQAERFDERRSTSPTLRVAFLGQLVDSKRPGRFIEAIQAARAAGAQLEATVIGEGPLLGALDGSVATLLGRRDDVASLLAATDVLVLCSRPESEGMPGVLIEAGLAGCAVITTDVPGAADVVTDATGVIVPVDPIEPLVEALVTLATTPQRAAELGAAGRDRCRQRFDVTVIASAWQAALDRFGSLT